VTESPPPSARTLALALAPGTLLAGIAGGIVFPIFPIVGKQVGLSLWFIGLILAANRAVRVVIAPLVGVLTDRLGGRRTLLFGLVVQIGVAALYLVGLATHHEGAAFLGGRLLHGVGSACVFVAAQTLALQAGGPNQKGGAAGLVRVTIVLGVPIGFVVGGLLSGPIGHMGVFIVAGGAITVAAIAAYFTVPDLRAPISPHPGFAAVIQAMRNRALLGLGGINFVLAFAASGMVLTTLPLLVDGRHLVVFGRNAEGTAGILMGILSMTDAAFTPFAGAIGDRRNAHAEVAAVSLAISTLGLLAMAFADGVAGTAIGIALIGVGAAGLGPSVLVMMGVIMPAERRGTGAGILQLCGDAGGMLGPLIGTTLFAGSTTVPYLATAAIVALFIPVALRLARSTRS
jgi:DHA1 family multidrug resistance protein-like MFS transporter